MNATAHASWETQPVAVQAIYTRLSERMPLVATTLRPDASFGATGGDSIDFVEFLCAIETDYGVRLTVDEIAPLQTVGQLLALVAQRATRRPATSSS